MLSQESRVGDYMVVRSRLLAQNAAAREDVQAFRKGILGGRLLSPEKVEAWLLEHAPKNGPEGLVLKVAAPATTAFEGLTRLKSPLTVSEILGTERSFLDYATPEARHVKTLPVSSRGPLAQLRDLCESLARNYHWQPAQATVFVLTGQIPLISSRKWSVHASDVAGGRLILDVDPLLSPKQLARWYADIRKQLVPQRARVRQLSEKHLTLAHFISRRSSEEPWEKRRHAWNAAYPRWKYGHESNFRRDAARAIARIAAPTVSLAAAFTASWKREEPPSASTTKPTHLDGRKRR
jgi:hypothetical protein